VHAKRTLNARDRPAPGTDMYRLELEGAPGGVTGTALRRQACPRQLARLCNFVQRNLTLRSAPDGAVAEAAVSSRVADLLREAAARR